MSEPTPGFNAYAQTYDQDLQKGLSLSGENKDFFAAGRVDHLQRQLGALQVSPRRLLDFGCGTGSATPHLRRAFSFDSLVGVDASEESLTIARSQHPDPSCRFVTHLESLESESLDLAYCNGVFHHIPPQERKGAIEAIRRVLKPGGYFSFWENNPLNPGTRWVMSRIPFDRDAQLVYPWSALSLLRDGGFATHAVRYHFIFPSILRSLRPIERSLERFPVGAQYHVLCQKRP